MKKTKIKHDDLVSVYVRKWPFEVENEDIVPLSRMCEIDDCSNEKVKGQKYYAWKLLERAMQEKFGLDMSDMGLKKEDSIWCCDNCEFSISHTDDIVAVVVSTKPVGVDIEENIEGKFDKILDKILHKEERKQEHNDPCKLWTGKEALFKKTKRRVFKPYKINTINSGLVYKDLIFDEKRYVLAVASDIVDNIKYNILQD